VRIAPEVKKEEQSLPVDKIKVKYYIKLHRKKYIN
jgi:hypothetical protein